MSSILEFEGRCRTMRIPASAALFLAALAALPTRGTDADNATHMLSNEETLNSEQTRPTVNVAYQMLHSTYSDIYNRNNSLSTNSINNTNSSLHFKHNLKDSITTITSINYGDDCCYNIDNKLVDSDGDDTLSKTLVLSDDGANIDVSDIKNSIRRQGRRKRVVSVVRTLDEALAKSTRNAEVSTVTFPTPSPLASERKRKPGETGSSSPLLNYIFDTYSSSHQHRNDRAGSGNSIYAAAAPEVEALVGSTAHLDCKVDALHDKLVSWVRRKNDKEAMDLLTTGTQLYTADNRYSARFIPPDIWRLEVKDVRPSDAAYYDCKLSSHPPRTARVTLHVPEVFVRIVDGAGAAVSEQVCEEGSTVALRCEVRGLRMEGGPALLWYRRDTLLNDDTTRGGISVRTEFGMNGANSVLRVARVRPDDAGRYTCRVARAPPITLPPATVILHVIKGESLAELHQGGCTASPAIGPLTIALAVCACFYK